MNSLSRRSVLRLAAPAILKGRYPLFAQSTATYSARAIRLVTESTVVDLLNQFRFADYAERPPKSELWLSHPESFYRRRCRYVSSVRDQCLRARPGSDGLPGRPAILRPVERLPRRASRPPPTHRHPVRFHARASRAQGRHHAHLAGLPALSHSRRRGRILQPRPAPLAADL